MVSWIGYSNATQFRCMNEMGMVGLLQETRILRVGCANSLGRRTSQVCEVDKNFVASNISGNKWIDHGLGLRYCFII